MKIRTKLPLTIFLLVSVPLIFLSVILYNHISKNVLKDEQKHMEQVARVQGSGISYLINVQKRDIELMAQLGDIVKVVSNSGNEDKNNADFLKLKGSVNDFLKDRLEKSTEIQNIYLADTEGNVIASAKEGLLGTSLLDRTYYKEVFGGKVSVSNVLVSKLNGERIIVIAAPIKNKEGDIIGLIGNSINMTYFSNFIFNIDYSMEEGYGYLVDSEGRIISHPDEEKIGNVAENDNVKILLTGTKSMNNESGQVVKYVYKGVEKYAGYSIIPGINWIVFVTQNASDINNKAMTVLYIILAVTLIVLAIALHFGMSFAKSIIKPISELNFVMNNAASGNLDWKCSYTSKDEFGELSENFNIMLNKLNASYEELNATYEELTATEEELRAQYEELQLKGEELTDSEERYRLAIEGAKDVIWQWDFTNNNFVMSDKWIDLTGHNKMDKFDWEYIRKNIIYPEDIDRAYRDLQRHIKGITSYYESEFRIKFKDGSYRWIFNRGKALNDMYGRPIKMAGSLTDISERKQAEEQMLMMAYYDKLTNLPNRTFFMDKLKNELIKSKFNGTKGALFFIDLDNFKNINDTLGHEYGDELLAVISKKFTEIKGDSGLVSRFGGDEFLILQPKVSDEVEVTRLAKDILGMFNNVLHILDKQIYITGSIGIAMYPRDGLETGTLLKNADAAMYSAKELGKNKYMYFNSNIYEHLQRKIRIENILRESIKNNELKVVYQPQYNINTKRICGFEALLRLYNSELGFIPPDEFIRVAEETGLIIEIGEWCLRQACKDNRRWKDAGYNYDFVAVNISSVQLQQVNFLEVVKNILHETGLEPQYLKIELTETVLMKSLDSSIEVLNKLRGMGIRIALDDFGTGYSSLNYLRKIPINILKIDKSFIDGIGIDQKQEAIVDGIIEIAHKMDLEVTAEGVESEYQLNLLKEKNCDMIQGYLISKPITKEEVEKLLKEEEGRFTKIRQI